MSKTETAKLEKLRAEWAAAQAKADAIKTRLAAAEARLTGEPAPETGLDMLWDAAPPRARTRSSKFLCRKEWLRIPPAQRPTVAVAVAAMKAWSRCEEWQKDDGQFVPAPDRWIKERRWEDVPVAVRVDPGARYRVAPLPPPPPVAPEDAATAEDIAEMFRAVNAALEGKGFE